MKIENVLASKGMRVITIRSEQSLEEAVAILVQHNIGALVVLDDSGNLAGIISERDIMRELARNPGLLTETVSGIMTRDVITGSPQDDLKSVLQRMTEKHFRHLPIIDQRKLVGIVSIRDIVNAQLEQYEGEIETLETEKMKGEFGVR